MLVIVFPLVFICLLLLTYLLWKLWIWLALVPKLDRLSEALWRRLPTKAMTKLSRLFDSEGHRLNLHRTMSLWVVALLDCAVLSVTTGQVLWVFGCLLGLLLQVSRNQNRFKLKQQAIVKELPDFCDLLAMMIAAGIPLIPAMARVSSACEGGRLASEIARANAQLRQGVPFNEALQRLADRYRLALLNEWTGLLIQGHQQGSSLVTTLRFHSLQMRQQLLNEAEKRAQEAPVKLLFPLMTCFFPVNFLVILGPIVLQLSEGGL